MKTLTSPVKVPFWKYKAFGISKYHFVGNDRIRLRCTYKMADGSYKFPNWLEIDTRTVFNLMEINPILSESFSKLYLIPWDLFEQKERFDEELVKN